MRSHFVGIAQDSRSGPFSTSSTFKLTGTPKVAPVERRVRDHVQATGRVCNIGSAGIGACVNSIRNLGHLPLP
jgi:hypothetical protein